MIESWIEFQGFMRWRLLKIAWLLIDREMVLRYGIGIDTLEKVGTWLLNTRL